MKDEIHKENNKSKLEKLLNEADEIGDNHIVDQMLMELWIRASVPYGGRDSYQNELREYFNKREYSKVMGILDALKRFCYVIDSQAEFPEVLYEVGEEAWKMKREELGNSPVSEIKKVDQWLKKYFENSGRPLPSECCKYKKK